MNTENLLRVADAIEKHEVPGLGFNMASFESEYRRDMSGRSCGTTACIAGWTDTVFGRRIRGSDGRARSDLGLSFDEATDLFYAGPSGIDLERVTAGQAICTLRYAAAHGRIDWDAANPAEAA